MQEEAMRHLIEVCCWGSVPPFRCCSRIMAAKYRMKSSDATRSNLFLVPVAESYRRSSVGTSRTHVDNSWVSRDDSSESISRFSSWRSAICPIIVHSFVHSRNDAACTL